MITRGISPSRLKQVSHWWFGPKFLQDDCVKFPTMTTLEKELPERKKVL